MGANQSKEELLYQAVRIGNHDVVKALRREGASLEWIDKEGRTPFLLACSRPELLDMAITLLNLGANMNAYRSGSHGGFPIHHAARRGLDKTVTLLLSRGANPLSVNDDDQTPLDLARSRGHVSVVRLLEERLCLFNGILRELSSFSFLESLAPNLVMKKIWAVVLPTKIFQEYELVIYESPKVCLWTGVGASTPHPAGLCNVAQPSTVLPLSKVHMEKLIFNSKDLVLQITDHNKTKYKFMSEKKNDRAQVERFYEACKGIPQGSASVYANGTSPLAAESQQGSLSQIHPIPNSHSSTLAGTQPVFQFFSASSVSTMSAIKSNVEPISEEIALALALDESIRTAAEEGIPLSPNNIAPHGSSLCGNNTSRYIKEWDDHNIIPSESSSTNNITRCQGNNDNIKQATNRSKSLRYSRWSSWGPIMCGPSSTDVCVNEPTSKAPTPTPSESHPNTNGNNNNTNVVAEIKEIGTCVICWDAPRQGVCIPCGHLAGCMDCLMEVESKDMGCPVCRGPIEQVVKVYTV